MRLGERNDRPSGVVAACRRLNALVMGIMRHRASKTPAQATTNSLTAYLRLSSGKS